jgi:hypothetical protein
MTPFARWANHVAETRETILASQDHLARIRKGLVRTESLMAQSLAVLRASNQTDLIAAQEVVLQQFK